MISNFKISPWIVLSVLLFIVGSKSFSQSEIVKLTDILQDKINISAHVEIIEDSEYLYDTSSILANLNQLEWTKNRYINISTNHQRSQYWIKGELSNQTNQIQNILLHGEISFARLIDFYILENGKIIESHQGGYTIPINKKTIKHANPIFPIEIKSNSNVKFLIHIDAKLDNFTFPLYLQPYQQFYVSEKNSGILISLLIGFLFMQLVMTLIGYFVIKDKLILFLFFYLLSALWSILAVSKFGYHYIYPSFHNLGYIDQMIATVISVFFLTILTFKFFEENSISKWVLAKLKWITFVVLFFLIFYYLRSSFYEFGGDYSNYFSSIPPSWIVLALFAISIIMLLHENATKMTKESIMFLILFFVIIIFIFINVSYNMGFLRHVIFEYKYSLYLNFLFMLAVTLLVYSRFKNFYSEKLALQYEILDAQKAKEQALTIKNFEEAKTRLYSNLSHEFRTPLTIIQGTLDRIKGFNEEKKTILRNNATMLHLVNQLLDLEKLDAEKLTMNLVYSDITKFIKYTIESFSSVAEDFSIVLKFKSEQDEIFMDYDPRIIQKIISNLISNALKFCLPGDQIVLRCKKEADTLTCSINDTGSGITKKDLPHIFDRFYQSEQNEKVLFGHGTGIGLALCKELITQLDGIISVESEIGKGSNFMFTLPITSNAETSIVEYESSIIPSTFNQRPPVTGNQINIDPDAPVALIVDDNLEIRTYLAQCIEDQFQIISAKDGDEGLELASKHIPDIIISDLMMPNMNGYEFSEHLKSNKLTSHIPILMLTARADESSKLEGLRKGADAYLTKPFNKEELLIRVKNLVQQKLNMQQFLDAHNKSAKKDEKLAIEHEYLVEVEKHILDNLDDSSFSVEQLAKLMLISRPQLYRKIKALTNCSIAAFIKKIRLTESKKLLSMHKHSISEIAYKVGFKDPAYFSNSFKEAFGQSPTSFLND